MFNRAAITTWISKACKKLHDYAPPTPIRVIKVLHLSQKPEPTVVKTYGVDADTDAGSLCSSMKQAIDDFCSGLGGTQRFMIEAIYGDDQTASASTIISIEGPPVMDDNAPDMMSDGAPGTLRGAMSQQYRFTETFGRMMIQQAQAHREFMERQLESAISRNEELERRNKETIELYEQLKSRELERNIVWTKVQKAEERMDKFLGTFQAFAPVAAAQLAKKIGLQLPPGAMNALGPSGSNVVPLYPQGGVAGQGAGNTGASGQEIPGSNPNVPHASTGAAIDITPSERHVLILLDQVLGNMSIEELQQIALILKDRAKPLVEMYHLLKEIYEAKHASSAGRNEG